MSIKDETKVTKQNEEITCLLKSIRDLLILNLSLTNTPHQNIAKAAHIQKSKLYKIIPKRKKNNKKNSSESNGQ